MKKILSLFLFIVILIVSLATTVSAENLWVCDTEDVLTGDTIDYINYLNTEVLSRYKTAPRFAIVVTGEMPEDYKSYASSLFNEYEMSKAANSYDVLLILAVNSKLYHIESGGGYMYGTLIEQDLNVSMIGEKTQNKLNNKQYDEAVWDIAHYYADIMHDQNSGEYATRQAEHDHKVMVFRIIIGIVLGLAIIGTIAGYVIIDKKKQKQENKSESKDAATE